jgi:hypothetical protein
MKLRNNFNKKKRIRRTKINNKKSEDHIKRVRIIFEIQRQINLIKDSRPNTP